MSDEPAFPLAEGTHPDDVGYCGMSLRDWFAGQALAGLCSSTAWDTEYDVKNMKVARTSYEIADAMLAAREPSK